MMDKTFQCHFGIPSHWTRPSGTSPQVSQHHHTVTLLLYNDVMIADTLFEVQDVMIESSVDPAESSPDPVKPIKKEKVNSIIS